MSHDPAKYRELLRRFREAHAKYGDPRIGFWLCAFTEDEWNSDPKNIEVGAKFVLGFANLPPNKHGYEHFLIASRPYNPHGEPLNEPCQCFASLANEAGAWLPVTLKRKLPGDPANSISRWLTFLWYWSPPDRETLESRPSETSSRVPWVAPFEDSADAIESFDLDRDEPTPTVPIAVPTERKDGNGEADPTIDTRAVQVLLQHEDWSKKQIAEEIGCHPKTLSSRKRCPRFCAAWQAKKPSRHLPRGSKSEGGDIEAWEG